MLLLTDEVVHGGELLVGLELAGVELLVLEGGGGVGGGEGGGVGEGLGLLGL